MFLPVKEIPATRGLVQSLKPTPGVLFLLDVTMLTTPGGIPASWPKAANCNADNGVSSAGFITAVQPQARAAANKKIRTSVVMMK